MRNLLLLLISLCSFQWALANHGGVEKKGEPAIAGTVIDAISKKPIADVSITAVHNITKAEHIISTDMNGNFKIAQLPLGTYKFKFDKDSYKSVEKNNITIKTETTTKVNVELTNYKDEELEDGRKWNLKFGF